MRTRAATTSAGRAGDAVATPAPEYTPKYVPGGRTYISSLTPLLGTIDNFIYLFISISLSRETNFDVNGITSRKRYNDTTMNNSNLQGYD